MYKGIILVLAAAILWGTGGVVGQYLYTRAVDPFWLILVRQIIAGVLFLSYAKFMAKENIWQMLKEHTLELVIFSFVGVLGSQLGFYYTISLCNAATATVLQYVAPVFIVLWMAWETHKLPDMRTCLGVVLAFLGVFLISTHGSLDNLAISPAALFWGEVSAVSYAAYSLYPRKLLAKYHVTAVLGWGQIISGLSLVAFRNPFTPAGSWDVWGVLAMAYLIVGATVLTFSMYLTGMKIIGPAKASLMSCAEPLSSIVCTVLFMGTVLTTCDYIGMSAIIFTVFMLSRKNS